MARHEQSDIIRELFDRLHCEFGRQAPAIIQIIVEVAGGIRLTIPDLQALYRRERNRRLRNEFTGWNHEELGFKYRLHPKQVRRIVQKG